MKIDNLKEVLEYAKLEELPQMNNDVPFKYAIGKVKTTAVEESYCVLNMLNGEPNVKKSFCGGMFVSIIGDIYPYDFTGVERKRKAGATRARWLKQQKNDILPKKMY